MKKHLCFLLSVILILLMPLSGCGDKQTQEKKSDPASQTASTESETSSRQSPEEEKSVTPENVPAYAGEPFCVLNDNVPDFTEKERESATSYEHYSALDSLGRCGVAVACIGRDLMPTEERGSIGQVKPTGWHTAKYDNVDGKYLYNRCHLIGFQLTGENANEKNLITGTRYLNVDGMLPFENMVADYVKETGNHVLYRVTPIFDGKNAVARGVQMEAASIEDNADGILFNVYVYNVQPGIVIDYATGESRAETKSKESSTASAGSQAQTYILNTNSKKFHKSSCSLAQTVKPANRKEYTGDRKELIKEGYEPCKNCNP